MKILLRFSAVTWLEIDFLDVMRVSWRCWLGLHTVLSQVLISFGLIQTQLHFCFSILLVSVTNQRIYVVEAPVGIFGVPLQDSIKYANVAISLTNEQGESYVYGYVPIVIAKCGVFLKEKGNMCCQTVVLQRLLT